MHREVAPGFHWIQECGRDVSALVDDGGDGPLPDWYAPDEELHIGQCAYLFADDRTLLFDTLSPASADTIVDEVATLLDGRDLDYLAVSHPDVPHAGNTRRLLREFPEATLVAPRYGSGHDLYHLDEALLVGEGDSLELGRYTIDFHEATFLDAALHMWLTERRTNTLFTVDWFGYPHTESECLQFAEEFDHPITADRLVEFHGRVLFWLQYVDVEKTHAEIDRLVRTYDPDVLAPAHGNVVREDAPQYMRLVKDVVTDINADGRIGILG